MSRTDRAVAAQLDPERLQPEPGAVRQPPGREQHLIDHRTLAVVEAHAEAVLDLVDRHHVPLDLQDDAALAHRRRDGVAEITVEAAQDLLAAVELGHRGAEAVHDAGELAGDIAAADDEHPFRLGLEVEDLVRGDAELGAGDRRHVRVAAGGDQEVAGGIFRAVREAHPVGVEDGGARGAELHPGPAQAVVTGVTIASVRPRRHTGKQIPGFRDWGFIVSRGVMNPPHPRLPK